MQKHTHTYHILRYLASGKLAHENKSTKMQECCIIASLFGEGKKNLETKQTPSNWGMVEKNCGTPISWICVYKRFEKYMKV